MDRRGSQITSTDPPPRSKQCKRTAVELERFLLEQICIMKAVHRNAFLPLVDTRHHAVYMCIESYNKVSRAVVEETWGMSIDINVLYRAYSNILYIPRDHKL